MRGQADCASNHTKALFLDRDGVINKDYGYVHQVNDFHFIDGIFDLVRTARAAGYMPVVITNQAGIARGYYSEEDFQKLTTWMSCEFDRRGAPIERVYYSPFHPTAGIGPYRRDEETRKPRPGMIYRAQAELKLQLEASILVGDKPSDILAGAAAGVGLNILLSTQRHPELNGVSHVAADSLLDVLSYLEAAEERAAQMR